MSQTITIPANALGMLEKLQSSSYNVTTLCAAPADTGSSILETGGQSRYEFRQAAPNDLFKLRQLHFWFETSAIFKPGTIIESAYLTFTTSGSGAKGGLSGDPPGDDAVALLATTWDGEPEDSFYRVDFDDYAACWGAKTELASRWQYNSFGGTKSLDSNGLADLQGNVDAAVGSGYALVMSATLDSHNYSSPGTNDYYIYTPTVTNVTMTLTYTFPQTIMHGVHF